MSANVSVQDRMDVEEAIILDKSTLDPNLHYRFCRDDPQNISRKKLQGYRFVSREKDKVKTLVDLEKTADDTIRLNELVLMCCPKSLHMKRRRERSAIVARRIESTTERFKEKAAKSGIDVRVTEKFSDKSEIPDEEE